MASHKFSLGARTEFAPLTLIRMFGKHKLGLVLIWLLLSSISLVVVLELPAIYRAEALILVDSQKIPERYVNSSVGTDLQDRLATINQVILSSTSLWKLIEAFDLYKEERKSHVREEIIEMMRSDIQLKVERGWVGNRPGAFRIAYLGKSPTVVAEVTNRLAGFYVEQDLQTRAEQAKGTSSFIVDRLKEAKKNLDDLEQAVSKYKLEHNGELPEQESSLNGTLSRLQLELQGIQEAISREQQNKLMLESALNMAESTQSAMSRAASVPMAGVTNPQGPAGTDTVRRKPSEILDEQLKLMRLRYSEDFPDVKRLEAQIAKLKAAEGEDAKSAERAGTSTTTPAPGAPAPTAVTLEAARELAQARERIGQLQGQLKLANRELEVRSAEQKRVLDAIALYEKRLAQIPVREQQMAALTRNYESSKAYYKSLTEKKESAEMATEMEMRQVGEKFIVLDQARAPEKPYSPNRPLFASLGCAVSLLFGFAFAVVKELKAGCVLGEWELPAHVAAIGRVPHIDLMATGAKPRRLRLALVSSAVISLALVAAGLYFAWSRM